MVRKTFNLKLLEFTGHLDVIMTGVFNIYERDDLVLADKSFQVYSITPGTIISDHHAVIMHGF